LSVDLDNSKARPDRLMKRLQFQCDASGDQLLKFVISQILWLNFDETSTITHKIVQLLINAQNFPHIQNDLA